MRGLNSGGKISNRLVIVEHIHQLVAEDEPLSTLTHLALGRVGSVGLKILKFFASVAKQILLQSGLNLTVDGRMGSRACTVLLSRLGEVNE